MRQSGQNCGPQTPWAGFVLVFDQSFSNPLC